VVEAGQVAVLEAAAAVVEGIGGVAVAGRVVITRGVIVVVVIVCCVVVLRQQALLAARKRQPEDQ
jgi:hypothetical protein